VVNVWSSGGESSTRPVVVPIISINDMPVMEGHHHRCDATLEVGQVHCLYLVGLDFIVYHHETGAHLEEEQPQGLAGDN
jgi:hypothetical protein